MSWLLAVASFGTERLLYGNYRQSPSVRYQGLPNHVAENPLDGKTLPAMSRRRALPGTKIRRRIEQVWDGTLGLVGQRQLQLHEVRNRTGAHFFHDLGAMNFDGAFAQLQ